MVFSQLILNLLFPKFKVIKKNNVKNYDTHEFIISSHPSPLSANSKFKNYKSFNEVDHFGDINKFLVLHNKQIIDWNL